MKDICKKCNADSEDNETVLDLVCVDSKTNYQLYLICENCGNLIRKATDKEYKEYQVYLRSGYEQF